MYQYILDEYKDKELSFSICKKYHMMHKYIPNEYKNKEFNIII